MIKYKLIALTIASILLFSCNNKKKSENETISQTSVSSPIYQNNADVVEPTSALPARHELVTTREKKNNDDGTITITTIATDGVETKRSEETFSQNTDSYSRTGTGKGYSTSNFEEAYSYSRKAYLNPSDIETANNYLKRAMSYFEDAESDADDIDCDDAKSSASYGYNYAKKGYNETDPDEIERYAKKAMSEAESGKSAMEDCKSNNK